ncbi:MAG: hypothetical protein IPG81_24025 [Sandaracinaceae bacterium]|nr:hypothetical protein [Sandaracinaceae bacterium]
MVAVPSLASVGVVPSLAVGVAAGLVVLLPGELHAASNAHAGASRPR